MRRRINKSKYRRVLRVALGVSVSICSANSWVYADQFALPPPGDPANAIPAAGPTSVLLSDPIPIQLPVTSSLETTVHLGFFDHPATTGTAFRADQQTISVGGLSVTTHDLFLLGDLAPTQCMSLAPTAQIAANNVVDAGYGALAGLVTLEEHAQFVTLCPTYGQQLPQCLQAAGGNKATCDAQFVQAHCPMGPGAACDEWGKHLLAECNFDVVSQTLFTGNSLNDNLVKPLCTVLQGRFARLQSVPQLCSDLLSCNAAMNSCKNWSSKIHGCDAIKNDPQGCKGSPICAAYLGCIDQNKAAAQTLLDTCKADAEKCVPFKATCSAFPSTTEGCLALADDPMGHLAACANTAALPTNCQNPAFCAQMPKPPVFGNNDQAACVMQCATYVGTNGDIPLDRLTLADARPTAGGNTVASAKDLELTTKFLDLYPSFPVAPNARQGALVNNGANADGIAVIMNLGREISPTANGLNALADHMALGYYRFTANGGAPVLSPSLISDSLGEPPLVPWAGTKCAPKKLQKDAAGNYQLTSVDLQQLQNTGCAFENDPVGIVAANLFGDPAPHTDLLVINRGKLPKGEIGFATLYRGQGFPAAPQHFADLWRYEAFVPLWIEPYGTAVAKNANGKEEVWVTSNVQPFPGFPAAHVVFRVFVDDQQHLTKQAIAVDSPGNNGDLSFGPYHIAAADLNGDKLNDFVVTWGQVAGGSIIFQPFVTVFLSHLDGTFTATEYQAPGIMEDEQKQPTLGNLATVQICDLNRDKILDLCVGDQHLYTVGKAFTAFIHYFPGALGGIFNTATAKSMKANVHTEFMPHASKVGGVRQLAIDADQNVAVLNGLPIVYPNPVSDIQAQCLDTDNDGLTDTPSWLSKEELAQKNPDGTFVHESDWKLCAADNCRPVHEACVVPNDFATQTQLPADNLFVKELLKQPACWNPTVTPGLPVVVNLQTDSNGNGNGDLICDPLALICGHQSKKQLSDGTHTPVQISWIFHASSENDPDHDYVPSFALDKDNGFIFTVFQCDNCANVANQDQADSDGDGAGNACDAFPQDPSK